MFSTFEELISQIDISEIENEILNKRDGEKELKDYEVTEVKSLLWLAGEKWLLRDLSEFTLTGTEVDILTEPDKNGYRFHAFIDVTGIVKGVKKPFNAYSGKPYCIDWKTTAKELDTKWRARLTSSWQWQQYAHLTGAKLFIFRGISRLESLTELIIKVPDTNSMEVIDFNNSVGGQIKYLRDEKFNIWPRNKPFACHAYGRVCEYYVDCDCLTMPFVVPPEKNLSYSYIDKFLLCPEKARRSALIDEIDDSSSESSFGLVMHRALASLWSQAFKLCQD